MIPILRTSNPADRQRVEDLLHGLRLDPVDLALGRGELQAEVASVQKIPCTGR